MATSTTLMLAEQRDKQGPGAERERFDVLLTEHEPVLRALAEKLCGDSMEASDLLQDTFERALRHASRFEPGSPRAWLVTIMRNLFLDRDRAQRRRPDFACIEEVDILEPDPEPVAEWESITLAELQAAVAMLDDRFRRVYELHTFEGASYDQIARLLAIPMATVGTRLARARQRIRKLLSSKLEATHASGKVDHGHAL